MTHSSIAKHCLTRFICSSLPGVHMVQQQVRLCRCNACVNELRATIRVMRILRMQGAAVA